MDYKEIANMPTSLMRSDVESARGASGWHESCLRAYHILGKVKWLLEKRSDTEVILELIRVMESDDFQPYAYFEKRYKEQNLDAELVTSLAEVGKEK